MDTWQRIDDDTTPEFEDGYEYAIDKHYNYVMDAVSNIGVYRVTESSTPDDFAELLSFLGEYALDDRETRIKKSVEHPWFDFYAVPEPSTAEERAELLSFLGKHVWGP